MKNGGGKSLYITYTHSDEMKKIVKPKHETEKKQISGTSIIVIPKDITIIFLCI